MGKVHFVTGVEYELSRRDTSNFITRMREGGVRFVMTRDTDPQMVLVISNCPIAFVVLDDKHKPQPIFTEVEKAPVRQEDAAEEHSIVEKEEAILAEIAAKAICTHDADKLFYMKSDSVKGTRYFQKCSFCGYRSKFIAADKLTDTEKAAAVQAPEE